MVVPLVEIVQTIITILRQIVVLARTAKSYRRKCGLLELRAHLIVRFLEELRKYQCMLGSATENMLNELRDTTDRALALVRSCQHKKKLRAIFMFYNKDAEFDALQEKITYIMQNFHFANLILLLTFNKQHIHILMTVLDMLLQGGACRYLPQSRKDDLKSHISGLKNCDHMSRDEKRLLERIVSDLNCKATSDPSGSEDVGTSAAGATGGSLVREVVRIANDILKKEKKVRQVKLKKEEKVRQVKLKKEDEVPLKKEDKVRQVKLKKEDELRLKKEYEFWQLARYAEEAIEILQQQQPVPASDTVRSLRDALGEGRDIVRRYIEGGGSGQSYSNDISTVLNRIERDLQIIVARACSHVYQTMHKKGR